MSELYLFDFAGDPDDRARREAQRAAERAAVRARYRQVIMHQAGLDEITADLVLSALFDHYDADGHECRFGHHPRLPDGGEHSHDAGFDCRCTWDAERRAAESHAWLSSMEEYRNSAAGRAERAAHDAEQAELAAWLAERPGVQARQLSSCAPEQWEGTIDGRSFYFRERHGTWRIELDLEPNGRFVRRVIGTGEDGEVVTEPGELRSGTEIAGGDERDLGTGTVEHLAFIVTVIRDHITATQCAHERAERFCPSCGRRQT